MCHSGPGRRWRTPGRAGGRRTESGGSTGSGPSASGDNARYVRSPPPGRVPPRRVREAEEVAGPGDPAPPRKERGSPPSVAAGRGAPVRTKRPAAVKRRAGAATTSNSGASNARPRPTRAARAAARSCGPPAAWPVSWRPNAGDATTRRQPRSLGGEPVDHEPASRSTPATAAAIASASDPVAVDAERVGGDLGLRAVGVQRHDAADREAPGLFRRAVRGEDGAGLAPRQQHRPARAGLAFVAAVGEGLGDDGEARRDRRRRSAPDAGVSTRAKPAPASHAAKLSANAASVSAAWYSAPCGFTASTPGSSDRCSASDFASCANGIAIGRRPKCSRSGYERCP